MAFEFVKKLAAELAFDKTVEYVSKDPERNFFTILDFAARVAICPEHKEAIQSVRGHIKNHPLILEQVKRIAINPKMVANFITNWVANNYLIGKSVREKYSRELGVGVPALILVDPTAACNLSCKGCWAGEYDKAERLEPELLDRILTEAEELGIYWIVFSGGEPFAYKPLLDVVSRHPDMSFMAYTNGTLIDEKTADRLAEIANLSPALSLEGWREQTDDRRGAGTFDKVIKTMDLLRERGVLFGASVTVTRKNVNILFQDDFVDFLIDKGAVYLWSFHYIPIGRKPDLDLMLTAEQRSWLAFRVPQLRQDKPIFVADFWNDGESTQGCIAGGRLYFHINAAGDVEPCAFAHFSTDNILGKSLKSVLQNPLFKAYQKRQPFNENHLAPCPIIDSPQALRDIVAESGAHPTHEGAEALLAGEISVYLDEVSDRWKKEAEKIKALKEESIKVACPL